MRVSDGARKINRHGGAIFIHDDCREDRPIDVRVVTAIPQAPIRYVAFPDSGKTDRVCISGSPKTISCRVCSFPCATARGAFKPARCDCLSPRRIGCDTSGSPLPTCRMEPAQAVHSISGSGLPIFRTMPEL